VDLSWLSPEIERVQAQHRARVEALYAGETLDRVVAMAGRFYGRSHGLAGVNEIDMLDDPASWLREVFKDMSEHAQEFADPVTFRPLAIELDPLGVHFIDALFGAKVTFHGGQVWSDPLECHLASLEEPDLKSSRVLQKALALANQAVQCSQGKILIATPVFSCPINIGINLFGERLLEALLERPDEVRRALRIVNEAIAETVRAFHRLVPRSILRNTVVCNRYAPEGFGQIDGCATHLVSGGHYRNFFRDLDAEVLKAWPRPGMIHVCGDHRQHIPTWAKMPEVQSLQVNDRATDDLEFYAHGLRQDQILYVSPTASMPVERILDVTRGRRVVLQCELKEPIR
jgi:hypothetical protein